MQITTWSRSMWFFNTWTYRWIFKIYFMLVVCYKQQSLFENVIFSSSVTSRIRTDKRGRKVYYERKCLNWENQIMGAMVLGYQFRIKGFNTLGGMSSHQYVVSYTTLLKAWKTKVRIFHHVFWRISYWFLQSKNR